MADTSIRDTAKGTPADDGSRSRVIPPSERVIPSIEEDQVREQLGRWVAAMRGRDAEAKLNSYAPVVDTFMGRRKIRREELLDRGLLPTGTVRKFDVTNVQVTVLNPTQAVILLDKSWDYGEKRRTAGSARGQLTLAKFGREWKITGERQLNSNSSRPSRRR